VPQSNTNACKRKRWLREIKAKFAAWKLKTELKAAERERKRTEKGGRRLKVKDGEEWGGRDGKCGDSEGDDESGDHGWGCR
jgi:hypothetical protein